MMEAFISGSIRRSRNSRNSCIFYAADVGGSEHGTQAATVSVIWTWCPICLHDPNGPSSPGSLSRVLLPSVFIQILRLPALSGLRKIIAVHLRFRAMA